MKSETTGTIHKTTIAAVATLATYTLQDVSVIVSIVVGCISAIWISAQLTFLLRKWYMLEKLEWAQKIDSNK